MSRRTSVNRFKAARCRQSYYQFFLEFWPLIAAEKLHDAWYIKKLCDELQVVAERVFLNEPKEYDLCWNCPPGTTKSATVSRLFQPWIWTRMPSARVISGSFSERLALDLSRASRDVVVSDKYQELFPEIKLRDDQNTKGYFQNTVGGMRYAVGVGGSVIGMHAHFILIDDPIDPGAALSDLMIEEANVWMNETLSRRKVNVMLTPTVLIMQRLHQDDPTGNMVGRGVPVRHFVIPGECENWDVLPVALKEFYEDGLLDPVRIPRKALEEAYAILGEVGYAGQYGQNPVPRGGAMFKTDRISYSSTLPAVWKRGPVRFWDKAATKSTDKGAKRASFTVGVKMAVDANERLWVLDVVRGKWDTGTRERMIDQTTELDGKQCRQVFEQEPGSGGKDSAESSVLRLAKKGYRASLMKASGDKELRADLYSQNVNVGNVVMVNGLWNLLYLNELKFFPRSQFKDQVDASSGGCSWLIKRRAKIGALE